MNNLYKDIKQSVIIEIHFLIRNVVEVEVLSYYLKYRLTNTIVIILLNELLERKTLFFKDIIKMRVFFKESCGLVRRFVVF